MFRKQRQLLWNRSGLLVFLSNGRDTPHLILFLFDNTFCVFFCACVRVQQQPLAQSAEESQTSSSCCAATPPCCCRRAFRWSCWRVVAKSASSEACRYRKPTVRIFFDFSISFLSFFPLLPAYSPKSLDVIRTRWWNGHYRIPSLRSFSRFREKNTAVTRLIDANDSFWRTGPFEVANRTDR